MKKGLKIGLISIICLVVFIIISIVGVLSIPIVSNIIVFNEAENMVEFIYEFKNPETYEKLKKGIDLYNEQAEYTKRMKHLNDKQYPDILIKIEKDDDFGRFNEKSIMITLNSKKLNDIRFSEDYKLLWKTVTPLFEEEDINFFFTYLGYSNKYISDYLNIYNDEIFVYEYKNSDTYEKIKDAVAKYCEKNDIENTENIIYGLKYNGSMPIVAEYNERYIKIYITELTKNQKRAQTTVILDNIIKELTTSIEDYDTLHQVITDLVEISPDIASIIFPMDTSPGNADRYKLYQIIKPILRILDFIIIILGLWYIIYFIYLLIKSRKKTENTKQIGRKQLIKVFCVLISIAVYIIIGGSHGIITIILFFINSI